MVGDDVDISTLSRKELLVLYDALMQRREELVEKIDYLKGKLVDQKFGPEYRPAISKKRQQLHKHDFSYRCHERT